MNNPARTHFERIVELPRDRWPALIAAIQDPDLRRDVQALLDAHVKAAGRNFMSSPTGPDVSAAATTNIAPISERPGTRIGPYKLLEEIGEGGFGVVFMAEQTAPIRRRVALKVIKLGMDSRQIVARFEQERQALALMDHPHIARVLDGGTTDSGRPYFVMEYVKGDPITPFAAAHKLSIRQRLDLFTQVCQAVQHAHHKGIIHRDLKPGNVLVSMTDGKPFAKVIDFGIAKATGAALTDKTLFTEHRQLIGTPEYMSPEQAEGSPDIDTRADVYALGVLLYELLTGLTPFDGRRLRSAAYAEMQRIIREEEPPAPSLRLERSLKLLAAVHGRMELPTPVEPPARAGGSQSTPESPVALGTATDPRARAEGSNTPALLTPRDLAGELDWIVMKALDKDRARRYDTPNQLAADVQRHLAGEAVQAAPPSAGYRLRKFVRKNKGPVIGGAAVAAALLVGISGTTLGFWQARRESAKAHAALVETDKQRDEAEWSSYTANLALAQAAIDAGNFPEARERIEACPEGNRGWEWKFLNWQARSTSFVIHGFAGQDVFTALSHNGRDIVLTSSDMAARVWDISSGQLVKELNNNTRPTTARYSLAAFSPDGTRIFTAMSGKAAQIWDAANGMPLSQLPGRTNEIQTASFSPDGTRIVTASSSTATTWNTSTGEQLAELKWQGYPACVTTFSPDGTMILTMCYEQKVLIWDAMPGNKVSVLETGFGEFPCRVAVSPDGKRIVTSPSNTEIARVCDVASGRTILELKGHSDAVNSAAFSPDGTRIVTTSDDLTARVWDAASGHPISELRGHIGCVESAAFSPDGTRIVTCSLDGTSRVWDAASGKPLAELQGFQGHLFWTAFSPDGTRIVRGSPTDPARIWDVGTPAKLATASGPDRELWYSDQEPDANIDLQISVICGRDGMPRPHELNATTPDGARRIVIGSDGAVRFLALARGEQEAAVFRLPVAAKGIVLTPDGTRLIISLADGSARVWDIRDPSERLKDAQAKWAERVPAGQYLDALWAGPTPTEEPLAADGTTGGLRGVIERDPTLSPLRRLVTAELLAERLRDLQHDVEEVVARLTTDQTDKATVQAAAQAADLPRRVKERVVAKIAEWQPPAPSEQAPK